ncbi:MAG: methyl-accepting chemotaxis protein [Planctomycetaceae bacterium]|nr:methyl-accepting chemotaxis protein [Planctomycetaceae bacterium]
MSLKRQIVLIICLPLALMSLCVGVYNYYSTRTLALENAEVMMDLLSTHITSEMDTRFRAIAQIGTALSRHFTANRTENADQIYAALEYAYDSSDAIYGGAVIFDEYAFSDDRCLFAPYVMRRGNVGFTRTEIAYDYTVQGDPKTAWFTEPKRTGLPHWSMPYFDEGAGNALMVTYSVPFQRVGMFSGVVGIDVSIDWLQGAIASIPGSMARYGYCSIVNPDGIFIAQEDEEAVAKGMSLFNPANIPDSDEGHAPWDRLRDDMANNRKGILRLHSPSMDNDEWVILTYVPMQTTGWYVLTVIMENRLMAPIYYHAATEGSILLAATLAVAIVAVSLISRLVRPIRAAARFALSVRDGDYGGHMEVPRQKEAALLVQALNDMAAELGRREQEAAQHLDDLRRIFGQIAATAGELSRVSEHVNESSQELSSGAEEQGQVFDQLASATSMIFDKANDNAGYVEKANAILESARTDTVKGNADMAEMNRVIDEISKSAEQVATVIKTIDDIAFQTNLLSLNAAIEAARAGWHGKGFSVVAEEVRRLARHSANHATESDAMLKDAVEIARRGVEMGVKTATMLEAVHQSLETLTEYMRDVMRSSSEQFTALSEIVAGLQQVRQVANNNAERAGANAQASAELQATAESLWQLLQTYRKETGVSVRKQDMALPHSPEEYPGQ